MTDENLNQTAETKTCDCPVCKLLRSDETKKFLSVILASFIGCSLALLVFAPKRHHLPPRHPAPCMRMMDRPFPPQPGEFRKDFKRHHYQGERRMAPQEFRHHRDFRPDGMKKFENYPTRHKLHNTPQIPQQTTPEEKR